MKYLTLTLTVMAPHTVSDKLILLIKFIRAISDLGLKEAKDFVEANFAGKMQGTTVHIRVPLTVNALKTLTNLNDEYNRVPGIKIDVYQKPPIFTLESFYMRSVSCPILSDREEDSHF